MNECINKLKYDHCTSVGFILNQLSPETLCLSLSGDWTIRDKIYSEDDISEFIQSNPKLKRLTFDTLELKSWDSSLIVFILKVNSVCSQHSIVFENNNLPVGIIRLLSLSSQVSENTTPNNISKTTFFLSSFIKSISGYFYSSKKFIDFIGEVFISFLSFLKGKRGFHFSEFIILLQECGVNALPIIFLINFLVGFILAFIGSIQLVLFGAQIYVASLVGISVFRVMGAVMTGIIMAGRTGASFAAQLGTMVVNEEIDALKTMGISPLSFLVLPRVLALSLMMPPLCLFADLSGVFGGFFVGFFMLDLNLHQYYDMTKSIIDMSDILVGLFKSFVFGILVSLMGCYRGIYCGRSAASVGNAATKAVVSGIVSIVIATAIITAICNVLDI